MSDLIRIVDLEIQAHVGVSGKEHAQPQRLLATIEMHTNDFTEAAAADDVSLTVDYFTVAQRVKHFAAERPRKLIETLAEEIAADLLEAFPIKKITVEIKKFVLTDARYVSVRIERKAKN